MERFYSVRTCNYALILSTAFIVSLATFVPNTQALTASYGRPYHGHLENGVPFPNCFPGYQLREESHTYTTPEVAGALLDAIEAVRTEFPDTCDLYIGDFSMTSGGSANHHRSHQNGRDVDIGMYAKGNRRLDGFMAMNEDNLDAAKTWCLIDNIIRSQRVQYIFLDRRVQQVLYNYAVTRGYDQAYLDRVFGNVRGSLIQHVRNHYDHIHVRFFTPWSTLAAHIGEGEGEKRMVIEMAQQSYLPKKVNYYVNANDTSLDSLAQSFGVTKRDLCRWNRLNASAVPVPGSCLVFYKRSFESEPVHLARSLQPGFIAARTPAVRVASLQPEVPEPSVKDASASVEEPKVEEARVERSEATATTRSTVYRIRRGDTVKSVARRNNMEVKLLCSLNGIKETTPLRPGRTLKTSSRQMLADAGQTASDAPRKASSSPSAICFSSDSKKPNSPTAAYYTVGKGDTLQKISRKSGISIDVLCQLNGLKRGSGLKPGQKIKLTQANLPVKPSLGTSACAVKPSSASKTPAAKGNAVQKAKGAQSAKADKKSTVKTAQNKPGQKSAAKQAAASKPAAKSTAKAKADVKATSKAPAKKAVEAKKPAGKSAPAEAKKKGASQSAAVKPAQKPSAQQVSLAKNSAVKK
ncbi:MAG: penicillin-insensitive murein endopeptidase [Syntrophobacter sp.]